MSGLRLGYLGFNVSDRDAWRRYAINTLGLMAGDATQDTDFYRMDSRAWRIATHEGQQDDIAYAGFEASSEKALSEVKERLRALGVEVISESAALARKRGVLGLLSCHDPAGVRVEIYYGATERYEAQFVSSAGVSKFVTEEQGLGHIVLCVDDLSAAIAFYTDGLGLGLADIIDWKLPQGDVALHFFNCNRRHHTLAIAPLASPKRLHHFMVEVGSLDDVGRTIDRMQNDTAIVITFGRHTNDHMYSFYGATPSGFAVECGWGPRCVDSDWSMVRYDSISMWGHKFVPPTT